MDILNLNLMVGILVGSKLFTQIYLEYLNRKSLQKSLDLGSSSLPREFADFVSKENFTKSVDYNLAKSGPNLIEMILNTLILLAVLYSGITPWFYETVTGVVSFLPGVWKDSFFIFTFVLFLRIFSFPLEWYRIFFLEEKFGFNTMTLRLWVVDFLKGTLISAILTLPLLSGLFYLVETAENYWWIWGWGGFTLFQFVMFLVYPKWIMPWFNKFSPLPEGKLREAIFSLCSQLRFKAREIMVMDGSRRSKHSNAFFTGIGKSRRVVFFDTLVEQLSVKEMQSVFAHEVGHFKKKHIVKMMGMMVVQMLLFFFLADLFKNLSGFNENFGLVSGNLAHTLILLSTLGGTVLFWFKPLGNLLSRRHEYEADSYAREAMGEESSLISALKKLYQENLGNLTPHPWYSFFYYSHPVLIERIRALSPSPS